MLNQSQLDDIILRTKRYPFLDGLPDFAMAVLWLIAGVISWFNFEASLPKSDMVVLALLVIPVAWMFGMRGLMTTIRRRWLWKDSGWVEPHPVAMPRWVFITAGIVWVSAVLISYGLATLGLVDDFFQMHMFVVSMGWGTAAFLIGSGVHLRLMRYSAAGIIGALAIAPLLFSRVPFGQTMLINGLVWFVLLSITGVLALSSVLRKANDRRD